MTATIRVVFLYESCYIDAYHYCFRLSSPNVVGSVTNKRVTCPSYPPPPLLSWNRYDADTPLAGPEGEPPGRHQFRHYSTIRPISIVVDWISAVEVRHWGLLYFTCLCCCQCFVHKTTLGEMIDAAFTDLTHVRQILGRIRCFLYVQS